MRVKFLLLSIEKAGKINRHFLWIGRKLSFFTPSLKYNIESAEIKIDIYHYLTAAFFSALIYGVIFFALSFGLLFAKNASYTNSGIIISFLIGVFFFFTLFILHIYYPKIMAQKIARDIDAGLILILRNMVILVSSGVSLYVALVNVAKANQGKISKELLNVVKDINSGLSEKKALQKLAVRTKSKLLKKLAWQIINSINNGSPIANGLKIVLENATNMQKKQIKNYGAELNLWILFYMLFAAAIPNMGVIVLVIFSSIGGGSSGISSVIEIIIFSVILQAILIGLVKSRIPKVYV